RSALIEGELSAADSTDASKKEAYKLVLLNCSYIPPEGAIRLHGEMNEVKVSRAEFVRWAVQVQGFPLPKFWNGSEPTEADTAQDHEGHGLSDVRILPMKLEVAVAIYRQHYKERCRDPDDPDTEPPTEKEDVALMKRLFPKGMPEKILRHIR